MFLVSSCNCLRSTHWSQVLSWEWRCSWSSAYRRCSNYIWVINNFIAYKGATYMKGFAVSSWRPMALPVAKVLNEQCILCTKRRWEYQAANLYVYKVSCICYAFMHMISDIEQSCFKQRLGQCAGKDKACDFTTPSEYKCIRPKC